MTAIIWCQMERTARMSKFNLQSVFLFLFVFGTVIFYRVTVRSTLKGEFWLPCFGLEELLVTPQHGSRSMSCKFTWVASDASMHIICQLNESFHRWQRCSAWKALCVGAFCFWSLLWHLSAVWIRPEKNKARAEGVSQETSVTQWTVTRAKRLLTGRVDAYRVTWSVV